MLGSLKDSLSDAKDNDIVNEKNCIKEALHNKEEIIPKYIKEIEGIEILLYFLISFYLISISL